MDVMPPASFHPACMGEPGEDGGRREEGAPPERGGLRGACRDGACQVEVPGQAVAPPCIVGHQRQRGIASDPVEPRVPTAERFSGRDLPRRRSGRGRAPVDGGIISTGENVRVGPRLSGASEVTKGRGPHAAERVVLGGSAWRADSDSNRERGFPGEKVLFRRRAGGPVGPMLWEPTCYGTV